MIIHAAMKSNSANPCGCDRGVAHVCKRHMENFTGAPFRLRVIIESPLGASSRAEIEENKWYARLCVRNSLLRNESPFASHLLYEHQEIMDDLNPEERELGITAGLEWVELADMTAVYEDFGITVGMERGIELAKFIGLKIDYRKIL